MRSLTFSNCCLFFNIFQFFLFLNFLCYHCGWNMFYMHSNWLSLCFSLHVRWQPLRPSTSSCLVSTMVTGNPSTTPVSSTSAHSTSVIYRPFKTSIIPHYGLWKTSSLAAIGWFLNFEAHISYTLSFCSFCFSFDILKNEVNYSISLVIHFVSF